MNYSLMFYNSEKKSRDNKWFSTIYAENDKEAIEKVEEKRKKGNCYYCKLFKIIYEEKIIKKWEK